MRVNDVTDFTVGLQQRKEKRPHQRPFWLDHITLLWVKRFRHGFLTSGRV